MKRLAGVLALLTFLLLPLSAGAQEKIHLFSSRATLLADSSLEVREDITVNVEGRQIRRGIYRDFPTTYTAPSGRTVRVGFDVRETLLDGREVRSKRNRYPTESAYISVIPTNSLLSASGPIR